jgi:hypothetical protein
MALCGRGWFARSADSWAEGQEVTTKYMIAFLDIYLGGPNQNNELDWQILTPEYALTQHANRAVL